MRARSVQDGRAQAKLGSRLSDRRLLNHKTEAAGVLEVFSNSLTTRLVGVDRTTTT